jgi:curved DNA-binding protein CbpA
MATKTFYELLEISPSASQDEIKESYRFLTAAFHPDKHTEANRQRAESIMKSLNEAYSVLSDADKRRVYDASQKTSTQSSDPLSNLYRTDFPDSKVDANEMLDVEGTTLQVRGSVYYAACRLVLNNQIVAATKHIYDHVPGIRLVEARDVVHAIQEEIRKKKR